MTLGYFISPNSASILVVMDYGNWIDAILSKGFSSKPILTRKANIPEHIAYQERAIEFPAWEYQDFSELIDDEIHSGADQDHLKSPTHLTLRVLDRSPQPQAACSF